MKEWAAFNRNDRTSARGLIFIYTYLVHSPIPQLTQSPFPWASSTCRSALPPAWPISPCPSAVIAAYWLGVGMCAHRRASRVGCMACESWQRLGSLRGRGESTSQDNKRGRVAGAKVLEGPGGSEDVLVYKFSLYVCPTSASGVCFVIIALRCHGPSERFGRSRL